jgi:tetratricopeptide (TPR) repeat protein
MDEALDNIDKTLSINPNFYSAFALKGAILTSFQHDYIKGIENYNKALTLIRGEEGPPLLREVGRAYQSVGFLEKAKSYYQEALELDNNKLYTYYFLAWIEFCNENFEGAYKLVKEREKIDSANYVEDLIPIYNLISGHDKEAYLFANKLIEYFKKSGILNLTELNQIGYAFWKVDRHKEAESYFGQQIKYSEESIKLGRNSAQTKSAQYNLASTYAFLGDKGKAYYYLDEFNKSDFYPLIRVILLKHDPLFANIRNEERFKKILKNVESKYQAEHERVRKWLEETGQL